MNTNSNKETNLDISKMRALHGNIIYSKTKDKIQIEEDSYLVYNGKYVEGIFKTLPVQYQSIEIEDFGSKIIIPGLIDLHIHAPQFTFRGLGMDEELLDWLNSQAFLEEARYSDLNYAKRAYTIFAEAMKQSATTRACIFATKHKEATILLFDLMEQTGLISYVGKINMDREAPKELCEPGAEESAFDTFGWINQLGDKYKRTFPILTPRFIPSCSNKLLEELREVRRAYNLPIQSHLSENPGEIEWVKSLRPDASFYGDAYDIYDLFGERNENSIGARTIMAHCVWSTKEEVQRIKDNGVYIAHCPASNMNLSSGIAPIRRYLDNGINIGLGSDVAGGQSESIFRAMTDAIQVSKMYWRLVDQTCKPLTFEEVFYLATLGGGKFFGNCGSFERGFEFDAIVLDDSMIPHPRAFSVRERFEQMVYLKADNMKILAKYVQGKRIL